MEKYILLFLTKTFLLLLLTTLCFSFAVIFLILNVIDKHKLSRINTFNEFKKKMNMIPIVKKLSGTREALTLEKVIEEIVKNDRKIKKARLYIYSLVCFLTLITGFSLLMKYHIETRVGYEVPSKLPRAKIIVFIILSLWINLFVLVKVIDYRIKMFLEKLNDLKTRKFSEKENN